MRNEKTKKTATGVALALALAVGLPQLAAAETVLAHLQERLDWDMAAALSVTLLVITLAIFVLFQRWFGLDRLWGGMQGHSLVDTLGGRAGERYRRSAGGWLVVALGVAVALFLIAPIVMIFPMSVSRSPFLVFPPPAYSWRWYENL